MTTGLDKARKLIEEYDITNKRIEQVTSIMMFNHNTATKLLSEQGKFVDLHEVDPNLGANMKNIIDLELHEQIRTYKKRLKEIEKQLGGIQ